MSQNLSENVEKIGNQGSKTKSTILKVKIFKNFNLIKSILK